MKKIVGILMLIFSFCMFAAGCGSVPSENQKENIPLDSSVSVTEQTKESEDGESVPSSEKDMIIVYFSYTNNTERVAELLKQKTGADIYEVEVAEPYSEGTQSVEERSKEERESGNLPELAGALPDLSAYETVLVGGPVWAYTVSTPLMSYLEQTDFEEKTVAPFWTDAGSQGDYEKDFTAQVKNGRVLEGLQLSHIASMEDSEINEKLDEWLGEINIGRLQ